MGAGMFFIRHTDILRQTFQTETAYMPKESGDIVHPFAHSMQWSRRFIGLKVFLTLAVAGWEGYQTVLRQQFELGEELRDLLASSGWSVVNETPLPIACFTDRNMPEDQVAEVLQRIVRTVISSGTSWVSFTNVGPEQQPVIRACITNHRTQRSDIEDLVAALNEARDANV
jgi:glutamate/tyrosine decarboxylase-like PLP-dependent enzyme